MRFALLAPVLAIPLYWGGATLEILALWLACGLLALALAGARIAPLRGRMRGQMRGWMRGQARWLSAAAATLLAAALLALFAHLLGDDFGYRAVWLYSGAELVWWLKLSALWAGEEGTLLLLAAGTALAAAELSKARGWAGAGLLAIALVFAVGTLLWSPFAAAPAEAAALPRGRGLNAHLDSLWMALHPPLVLLAYALLLLPVGAALQSLARGDGALRPLAERWLRLGWLLLTLGLATGMAWSYEDATFGQLWHWDPVQTAVFASWALATAALHGLRVYHPSAACARSFPLLVVACAASVPLAMAVTRSQTLASSHRYIGDTAQPLFLLLGAGIAAAGVGACWLGRGRAMRRVAGGALWLRRAAMLLFAGCAALALLALLQAGLSAGLELPRPESTQPFLDTVRRWGDAELLRAFARWEVDPYAVNRWLAPPAALLALLGGHAFLDALPKRIARALTLAAALLGIAVALRWSPLTQLYSGRGMTSLQTLENFFWLELLYAGLLWLVLCAASRGLLALRRGDGYLAGVASLHAGAALALGALLAATLLDSYSQRSLRYPEDFHSVQRFADGYALSLSLADAARRGDGARGAGFVAEMAAELALPDGGTLRGLTRLREAQPPAPGDGGAMRQLCEILDYRYARAAGGPSRRLDPLIERGLWRDVQLWVPAPTFAVSADGSGSATGAGSGALLAQPGELTVVIKRFPLVGLLWLGLAVLCLAAAWLTWRAWLMPRRAQDQGAASGPQSSSSSVGRQR